MKSRENPISIILSMFLRNIGLVSVVRKYIGDCQKSFGRGSLLYRGKLNQEYMLWRCCVSASGVTSKTSQDGMYNCWVKRKEIMSYRLRRRIYTADIHCHELRKYAYREYCLLALQMTKKNATIT